MILACDMQQKSRRRQAEGFTLVETAIVIGIVALVLGAIWGAASMVLTSSKVRVTVQELQGTVHNLRAIFAEQGGVTDNAATFLTQAVDQLKAFPLEMRQNQALGAGVIFHPWSQLPINAILGSVQIDADNCAGTADTAGKPQPCFGIKYIDVPQEACIRLVGQTSQPGLGLQEIDVNGKVAGAVGGALPLPVLESTAQGKCDNGGVTGNSNDIFWIYSVKGNTSS